MKIALIGYGKMGRMIEECALEQGVQITARMTRTMWDEAGAREADVWIEFTSPEEAVKNILKAVEYKKPIVIGTTGWYDQVNQIEEIILNSGIGAVFSPNYSIGVNIFFELVAYASELFNPFIGYDAAEIEYHHREKKDSPSGTALEIANAVKKHAPRLKELPISSVRCGTIPGKHALLFDSVNDAITLTHESHSRKGFGEGVLRAAHWIKGRKGFYEFREYIHELLQKEKK